MTPNTDMIPEATELLCRYSDTPGQATCVARIAEHTGLTPKQRLRLCRLFDHDDDDRDVTRVKRLLPAEEK